MSTTDGGATALETPYAWDDTAVHALGNGQWSLDGVGPVPGSVVARFVAAGGDFRGAAWGRLLRIVAYPFPGTGVRTVYVAEKGALVYLPENHAPYDVQGVLLAVLPAILAAP